jgi:hypothetical protein
LRSRALTGPLLLVAHDAGGAEVVSSWARRSGRSDIRLLLDGPARQVFARKLPGQAAIAPEELETAVREASSVLTGTSWASDLERRAIRAARGSGVPVASFLDHWVNYPQRFLSAGQLQLPGEIWVGDEDALEIARRHFPEDLLRLEPNPYFADVRDELRSIAPPAAAAGLRVLYVSEPIAEHFAVDVYRREHPGYDEFEALAHCLQALSGLPGAVLRLRPHPAERPDKYRALLGRFQRPPVHMSSGTSLLEDCTWANWVVGCETMAMVIGLLAGRQVYTSIPPAGRACALPQKEIRPLPQGLGG